MLIRHIGQSLECAVNSLAHVQHKQLCIHGIKTVFMQLTEHITHTKIIGLASVSHSASITGVGICVFC